MFSNRNSTVGVDASLTVAQSTPIGSIKHSTLYKVEAFPPVDIPSLKMIIGEELYAFHESEFTKVFVWRSGEWQIPLSKIHEIMGDKLTRQMHDILYSRPLWIDENHNLVVMVGLNDSLDKQFKASSYTAAWYVGIVTGTPSFAEGDTMASHAGWNEVAPYSGARPTLSLGSIVSGSVDNSASKATYSITNDMVVGGAFLVTLPTAGQTSGTVYGGAAFSGGNRTVANGDTLNVTVTLTATAS